MFDDVDPWVSDVDIASGAQGLSEIHKSLGSARFGIVVVTPGNQDSAWLNYEAGALSRAVQSGPTRVIPLLVDLQSPTQIAGPLGQFQCRRLDKDDLEKLTLTFSGALGVERDVAITRFQRSWPDLFSSLQALQGGREKMKGGRRSIEDMMEEALGILRRQHRRNDVIPIELAERLLTAADFLETPLTDSDLRSAEVRQRVVSIAADVRSVLDVLDYR